MSKPTDVRVVATRLFLLPVRTRMPLKFGKETLNAVTCARVQVRVANAAGETAEGWGETPLSVQWVWPSTLPLGIRERVLIEFCQRLAKAWVRFDGRGHALELGIDFQEGPLREEWLQFNRHRPEGREPMPWLAALVVCSAFDLALHDAFGCLHQRPVYQTYDAAWLSRDLAAFLEPASTAVSFAGLFADSFLAAHPPTRLAAWHLVGGVDPVERSELTGAEPDDGYPVLLEDWIQRDGLKCLKVKLRGNDEAWDWERVVRVGNVATRWGAQWLSADFNCTVHEPGYVNAILDRLRQDHPRLFGMLLYVEQPFPYDLEAHRIDVRSVSARKPLFLDESAHDWRLVRLGRELGWTGVALKTCKTQSGALLSACWAKAHGMALMVQDLTNPMLAQIPHVLLAAHTGTIMGVETNAMQFYPEASLPEARVHPGLYRRTKGCVDLSSVRGAGFGYRVEEIQRVLPEPALTCGW